MTPFLIVAILSQTPVLGGVGESCRARVDCEVGLKCIASVCTAPAAPPPPPTKEGQACAATSECSETGELRCINKVCQRRQVDAGVPAPAPVQAVAVAEVPPPPPESVEQLPPPPSAQQPRAQPKPQFIPAEDLEEEPLLSGTHFFIGGSLVGGLLYTGGEFGPSFQLGWLFDKKQLVFDIGVQFGDFFVFNTSAVFGFLLPLHESNDLTVAWTLRGGVTALSSTAFGGVGPRLDLIGVVLRFKSLILDFQLPTAAVLFGTGVSFHINARASIGFTF